MTAYVRTQGEKKEVPHTLFRAEIAHADVRNSHNIHVGVERRERARPQHGRDGDTRLSPHVRLGSYLNTFQLLRGSRSEIIETMLEARAARALLGQNAAD